MKIAVILLRWILNFIYFFLKLLPVQRSKILFLSRQSDKPGEDFEFLKTRLLEINPELNIVMITKRADNNISSMLIFAVRTLQSMYHLATASVCVLDSYWPAVSVLKHKQQLAVIQLWHAMGKIKQSGYQSLGKKFGRSDMIAREMRMHRNYDVIVAGGRAFNPFYCASFNVSEDILYNVGLPRMDKLREGVDAAREQFYAAYPQLKGKRIVLYAPTFRKGQTLDPSAIVNAFDFDDDQVLVIKRHPNQKLKDGSVAPAITCSKVPTSVVLSVCDCVITDYSAITIEAAILGKPVYFYLFDLEDYLSHNGLNVMLSDEFPDCVFSEPEKLFDAIKNNPYDFDNYGRFRRKYLPDMNGRATDKIADLIMGCMERNKHETISQCIAEQNRIDSAVDSEDTVRT